MNEAINLTLAMVVFGGVGFLWAAWFSETGSRELSRYFTARTIALPRKRRALLDARRNYRREMQEMLALYTKTGPVEIRKMEKTA